MSEWYDPYNIVNWPAFYRRLFILTLPISGPLWMLWLTVMLVGCLLLLLILGPIAWVWGMWRHKREYEF
jgi:hypothetical protein